MGLGARLAASFAALVAATALLAGGASFVTTDRQVTDEIDGFLRVRADEIVDGRRPRPPGEREGAELATVDADAEVQVLDPDGAVVAGSGIELPVDERDRRLARRDDPPILRTVKIDDTEYRMLTSHVSPSGAIQVARSLDEANSLLGLLRSRLLLNAAVLAVLAAGAGWVVAQRTTRPLRSLTAAVDAVAETRDFTVPVAATGNDEVGRLARGFDRMLRALDLSRAQQHRLVQDAAHELRTPLTSIKANVDWLSRADDLDPDTRREVLAGVQRELGELDALMDEIIDLATDSQQQRPHERVDLAAVAADAVARFGERTHRPVSLDAEPTPVLGDPDAIERAIGNLLSNADKYSPPGTEVTVEVLDGWVWVSDRGDGIPVTERERVFDRFHRREADRSRPGSGLGLSIVAGIVDAHHGQVAVTDAAGGGARVGFGLPVL